MSQTYQVQFVTLDSTFSDPTQDPDFQKGMTYLINLVTSSNASFYATDHICVVGPVTLAGGMIALTSSKFISGIKDSNKCDASVSVAGGIPGNPPPTPPTPDKPPTGPVPATPGTSGTSAYLPAAQGQGGGTLTIALSSLPVSGTLPTAFIADGGTGQQGQPGGDGGPGGDGVNYQVGAPGGTGGTGGLGGKGGNGGTINLITIMTGTPLAQVRALCSANSGNPGQGGPYGEGGPGGNGGPIPSTGGQASPGNTGDNGNPGGLGPWGASGSININPST